ncbi:MAG: pantoate--beta-alanine ligase [Peptostreptococcaceae bacterium]|nr:pantoate--beta-alanine ligase [Peptostreptococcaceae bacterium]
MDTINEIDVLRYRLKEAVRNGKSVGLVPTMGYLHEGHLSLIKRARKENDLVVVSLFVNPTQFGPGEDLDSYPKDLEKDASLCESEGADLLFAPDKDEMYYEDYGTYVDVTGELTKGLCGKTRPTHFGGVTSVVSKLFNIVSPDRAYFGQKDAQQVAVIKRMVRDLNFDIEIVVCPIVREADGLAKSSRNIYLTKEEREAALVLNRSLKEAADLVSSGERDPLKIKTMIEDRIRKEPLSEIDYVELVDADRIEHMEKLKGNVLIALAVRFGKARLIDNIRLEVE